MELAYTSRNIRKRITILDIRKNPALESSSHRDSLARNASKSARNDSLTCELKEIKLADRTGVVFPSLETELVFRLLSKNLKTCYNIQLNSRQTIIENLVSFLEESFTKSVYRFDIQKFYQNINVYKLLEEIRNDGIISNTSLKLIERLQLTLKLKGIQGLPPGLSISGVLAEIWIKSFDKSMRNIDGVLFFGRFVDDFIAVTDTKVTASHFQNQVNSALPDGLRTHQKGDKKTTIENIGRSGCSNKPNRSVSYLGYNFEITNSEDEENAFAGRKKRKVEISISHDKFSRMKRRLFSTLISYAKSSRDEKDLKLLQFKLQYLTSNQEVVKSIDGRKVKVGIFYNYNKINRKQQLSELDNYLLGFAYGKSKLFKSLGFTKFTNKERKLILSYSFLRGFNEKIFFNFSQEMLANIKGGW
ncbi:hypothetical protein A6K25_14140 [Alteromonas stellipolaris]|uniref:antiviral reverse transcriptase Drt3a n=1 Tax=Alteromonas stellipolaris TaxID=233316 RepID=UPI0007B445C9|nr:antiviral reverse transcriptase Drt3a [Alteromonas stellipolaris]ANB22313.1 hypothetical protein A6K25_14140 [Alteromonas stellipolaris]